jgi:DNA-binding MarR family transcriptional regulator
MNKLTQANSPYDPSNKLSHYQASRLKDLIEEISYCCQERLSFLSEKFNLTPAQLRTLLLFKNERYLTVTAIAQKLEVAKSRVTIILNGLLEKKIVHRIDDPEDARVKLISLTLAGQKMIRKIDRFMTYMHHQLVLTLNPEERQPILSSLELLRASMKAVKERMADY